MSSRSQKGITLEKNSGSFKKTEGADPIKVPRDIARKTAPLESLDSPVEHSGVLKPDFSVVLHRHAVQNGLFSLFLWSLFKRNTAAFRQSLSLELKIFDSL